MRTIKYFDTELTVEDYIKKEILKNAGSQNIAMKTDLVFLCNQNEIPYNKNTTKEEMLELLIQHGFEYENLAAFFGIGVSSQVYQKAFNISHADVKRLEKHGVLEVVGSYRYRAFGHYNYAPLYDLYQYARMTDNDMEKLLEQYPKGKRVKKVINNERMEKNNE